MLTAYKALVCVECGETLYEGAHVDAGARADMAGEQPTISPLTTWQVAINHRAATGHREIRAEDRFTIDVDE